MPKGPKPIPKIWVEHKTGRLTLLSTFDLLYFLCGKARISRLVIEQDLVEGLVTCVFAPYLKAYDHTKFNFNFTMYIIWMSFKGPHNFMGMALGHSVEEWALPAYERFHAHLSYLVNLHL